MWQEIEYLKNGLENCRQFIIFLFNVMLFKPTLANGLKKKFIDILSRLHELIKFSTFVCSQISIIDNEAKEKYKNQNYVEALSGLFLNNISTIDSSARVDVSPTFLSLMAILRKILRIILPDLVFGKPGAYWITSGMAKGPIFSRTENIKKMKY